VAPTEAPEMPRKYGSRCRLATSSVGHTACTDKGDAEMAGSESYGAGRPPAEQPAWRV
jgi:hypothetical protein